MRENLKKNIRYYILFIVVIHVTSINYTCFAGTSEPLINRAKKFQMDGEYANAFNEYYKAIIKEPANPATYEYLAVLSELILKDYTAASIFYEKELSLIEYKNELFKKRDSFTNIDDNETVNEIDEVSKKIVAIKSKKSELVSKILEGFSRPIYPTYIVLKNKKKVYKKPVVTSKPITGATDNNQREFVFLSLYNNWFKVRVSSTVEGWINWKDINLIYQNNIKPLILSKREKVNRLETFVYNFASTDFAANAMNQIDKIYFEIAEEINNIESYKLYLQKCPEGKNVKVAEVKIAEFSFEFIYDDIEKLKIFINNYPDSVLYKKASERIKELEKDVYGNEIFENAKKEHTLQAYNQFIKEYPDNKSVPKAQKLVVELEFKNAEKEDTIITYNEFITKYPQSIYTDVAKRKIAELEYKPYKDMDTLEGYEKFLEAYPSNIFVGPAKIRITELKNINSEESKDSLNKVSKKTEQFDKRVTEKLIELEEIYKTGLIDKEEFEAEKEKILKGE